MLMELNKNQPTMESKTITTVSGATFKVVKKIKDTALNRFTGNPVMYEITWANNETRVFSPLGIDNIKKYQ